LKKKGLVKVFRERNVGVKEDPRRRTETRDKIVI